MLKENQNDELRIGNSHASPDKQQLLLIKTKKTANNSFLTLVDLFGTEHNVDIKREMFVSKQMATKRR